jgi:hypothetical protein
MQRVGFLMLQLGLPQGFRGDSNRFLKDITDAILLYADGLLYLMKGLLLEEKGRLAEAIKSYQLGSITPSMMAGSYCRLTGLALLVLAQTEAGKRLAALPVLGSTTVGLMASPLGQGPLLAASAPTCGRTQLAQAVQTLKELVRELSGPQGILPDQAVTVSMIAMILDENELALWIVREGERHGPENLDLMRRRLLAEQRTGNWLGVIETARKILALNPKDSAATIAHDRAVETLRRKARDLVPPTSKGGPG